MTDKKNGDFDTYAIFYAITPESERSDIYRYFKSSDDESGWTEIDVNEWNQRVQMSEKLRTEINNEN